MFARLRDAAGASFSAPAFSKAATLASQFAQGNPDENRVNRRNKLTNGSGFPFAVMASCQRRDEIHEKLAV